MSRNKANPDFIAELANRLTAYRLRSGLSQAKLGELCNMPQSTVQRIEAGKTNVSVDTICRLCEQMGVSLHEFFEGL